MQPDTRKFLKIGSILVAVGVLCAVLMLTVFGGVTRQGPHTNLGWISLIIVMGCLPLGTITLLFGLMKFFGNRTRLTRFARLGLAETPRATLLSLASKRRARAWRKM